MWIPNLIRPEQSCGEVCHLCGVFRNGAAPDPLEAALPYPVPWTSLPESTEEEMQRREILLKCRACGSVNTFDAWTFSGKFCPDCGSRNGAIRP